MMEWEYEGHPFRLNRDPQIETPQWRVEMYVPERRVGLRTREAGWESCDFTDDTEMYLFFGAMTEQLMALAPPE